MINHKIIPGIIKPPRPMYEQLCECMCVLPSEGQGLHPLPGEFRRLDRVLASEQNVALIQEF